MAHNAEEWRRLRSEFIEAAAKYDEYETFIERTAQSEDWYSNNGRYLPVGLIRWPYGSYRKCSILAPNSGENAEPFSTMKTLFSKAWLWLPRDIADEVVDTAKIHLSEPPKPPDDRGLWWARSYYQYWCWLLWFHWLRQHKAANPTEAEKPSKKMVMSPFHCSAELIGQWGLDGSDGTIPEWLADPVIDHNGAASDVGHPGSGTTEPAGSKANASGAADSKTDSGEKSPPAMPDNHDVAKLARKIDKEMPVVGNKTGIASDYCDDSERANTCALRGRRPGLLQRTSVSMSSSKENEDRARELLRPYVENPAFRQYVKEQILKWEAWHRSQKVKIRSHEIWRDQYKEKLEPGISLGTIDSEDPDEIDNIDRLSYEFHSEIASSFAKSSEFRLLAEREPFCFSKAGSVAMVALFWCDINDAAFLVPDYSQLPDFEPDKPFLKYFLEQRRNPIQGRYKYIDWFVEAAIRAYVTRASEDAGQSEEHEHLTDAGISLDGLADDDSLPAKQRKLAPSRVKAKAAYEWAMSNIPGAEDMTIAELYGAVECHPSKASDMLPPNAEAFGRYLRDAGVRRYNKLGKSAGKSVQHEDEL